MSRPWRVVVGSLTAMTIGYALWLLLVGGPVGVSDSSGASVVARQPVWGAIVPVVLGIVSWLGLRRESASMVWTGAIGVFVYGLLAIFGMGLYMPILGGLSVLAMLGDSVTRRHGAGHPAG